MLLNKYVNYLSQHRMGVKQVIPGIYKKAKSWIKKGVCIKFYVTMKHLYLETDALALGLEGCITTNKRWDELCKR